MGQRLVVSNQPPHPVGPLAHGLGQPGFETGLAGALDHDLHRLPDQRGQRIEDEIDALLLHHATDVAEQHHIGILRQAELTLQGQLVLHLAVEVLGIVGGRDQRIGRRIPCFRVDAVDDADQIIGAVEQQARQAVAEFIVLDLLGIAGADGGDAIGIDQPALDERQHVVELHAVMRPGRGGQRQLGMI